VGLAKIRLLQGSLQEAWQLYLTFLQHEGEDRGVLAEFGKTLAFAGHTTQASLFYQLALDQGDRLHPEVMRILREQLAYFSEGT
jgi:hypothetical protein